MPQKLIKPNRHWCSDGKAGWLYWCGKRKQVTVKWALLRLNRESGDNYVEYAACTVSDYLSLEDKLELCKELYNYSVTERDYAVRRCVYGDASQALLLLRKKPCNEWRAMLRLRFPKIMAGK